MRREILIAAMLMSAGGGVQGKVQQAEQCPAPGTSFEADVSGQIVDDQGRPVPGVEIWSVQPERRDGVFPKAVSGPEGRFSLPRPVPGSEGYLVTSPAGFGREQVDAGDLPSGPLRLPLRRLGRIAGRVVDPDGGPVAGARVSTQLSGTVLPGLVCTDGAPPPPPCNPKTWVNAEARETGRFEIDSVEPGWYEVSAEGEGAFPDEIEIRRSGFATARWSPGGDDRQINVVIEMEPAVELVGPP